jgi:ArsR family transcriptional regulator, lead/cadmium/zinc/bismuth-responsive transcriptional repressor
MKADSCIRVNPDTKAISRNRSLLKNLNGAIEIHARSLNLIGNEVRLKILFLLSEEKNICVCDLSDVLNMNASAISQHLRKLKDGEIIYSTRDGQTIYYSLNKN